jgi:hypothetical protein
MVAAMRQNLLYLATAFVLVALNPAQGADAAWPRHVIDDSSRGADGVRLADVNGDGRPDITTGWEQGGVVRVYLHPGPARVRARWPAVTVGTARDVEDAVFADLDGDGAMDVISASEGRTRSLWIHWAPRDPSALLDPAAWTTAPLPASGDRMMWMFTEPLDVDGRHGLDLVAGGKGAGAALGWFRAPARPRALADWTWHPLRPAGWTMSIIAADMDGDGDADLLFSDRKGPRSGCFWLENPGRTADQTQPWKEHLIGAAGREVMFLRLADLDGDDRPDVLACVAPDSLLWFQRKDRAGIRWQEHRLPVPELAGLPKAVNAGDLDQDGRLDVVFTCEKAVAPKQGVWWLRQSGPREAPVWQVRTLGGVDGVKHDLVEVLDLDDDGDLDVLTCEEVKNLGVFWYENPRQ